MESAVELRPAPNARIGRNRSVQPSATAGKTRDRVRPVQSSLLAAPQQAKFGDFIACFNNERPHQALNMRYPAERYVPSTRPYTGLPNVDYPFHDRTVTVTTCGRICFNRQKINLSGGSPSR